MAWDVSSRVAKVAWDVLYGVEETAWDVLTGWQIRIIDKPLLGVFKQLNL